MCNCINIDFGTYENQVQLSIPPHMLAYQIKDGASNTICVDKCISEEIKYLWSLAITTTGCCCGHNKLSGFIGVIDRDIPYMKELGYEVAYNYMRPNDEDSFFPKTILRH